MKTVFSVTLLSYLFIQRYKAEVVCRVRYVGGYIEEHFYDKQIHSSNYSTDVVSFVRAQFSEVPAQNDHFQDYNIRSERVCRCRFNVVYVWHEWRRIIHTKDFHAGVCVTARENMHQLECSLSSKCIMSTVFQVVWSSNDGVTYSPDRTPQTTTVESKFSSGFGLIMCYLRQRFSTSRDGTILWNILYNLFRWHADALTSGTLLILILFMFIIIKDGLRFSFWGHAIPVLQHQGRNNYKAKNISHITLYNEMNWYQCWQLITIDSNIDIHHRYYAPTNDNYLLSLCR